MKKNQLIASALLAFGFVCNTTYAQTTIPIFDEILYFDGYAPLVDSPAPPPGIIRHRNDLYAVKLTDQQLSQIGSNLTMNVTIKASCDNYDRIGNINLALVPKGAATYKPDSVQRIEIGRYITPFMNKNIMPDKVPYTYNIDNVANLLKETSILSNYDIWVELQVFGVPYAANEQVSGCANRNDVFFGSLEFVTSGTLSEESNNVLIPLNFQKRLNDYQEGASDAIGQTKRTITFNVDQPLSDAMFVLITSNHGAGDGGEEYERRQHYIKFDGNDVLSYKPGRTSCEPFRVYNTQGNGIYGSGPRTDAQWQSFSNWCPGDVIDNRIIQLGNVSVGSHTFVIDVPDAQFVGDDGYFPVSLYLQGKISGTFINDIDKTSSLNIYPNPSNDVLNLEVLGIPQNQLNVNIINYLGQTVYSAPINNYKTQISTAKFPSGMYSVICTSGNSKSVQKIVITH